MLYPVIDSQSSLIGTFFFEAQKKSRSEARGRIFSRSPMVLVMAFPTPGVQYATWSSSSAAHI